MLVQHQKKPKRHCMRELLQFLVNSFIPTAIQSFKFDCQLAWKLFCKAVELSLIKTRCQGSAAFAVMSQMQLVVELEIFCKKNCRKYTKLIDPLKWHCRSPMALLAVRQA